MAGLSPTETFSFRVDAQIHALITQFPEDV